MTENKETIEIGKKFVGVVLAIFGSLITTAIISLFAYVVSTNDRLLRMEMRQDNTEKNVSAILEELKTMNGDIKTVTYQQAKIIQLMEKDK